MDEIFLVNQELMPDLYIASGTSVDWWVFMLAVYRQLMFGLKVQVLWRQWYKRH